MKRFRNEFWKTLTLNEKIEFSTVSLILTNIVVALGFVALETF